MSTKKKAKVDPLKIRSNSQLVAWLESKGACHEAVRWVEDRGFKTLQAAWVECDVSEWMWWLFDEELLPLTKEQVAFLKFVDALGAEHDLSDDPDYLRQVAPNIARVPKLIR